MSGLKGVGVAVGGRGVLYSGECRGERKEQQREVGEDRQVEKRLREADRETEKLAFQKSH